MMRDELKKRAAERAIEFVQDGQVVGLGTGSTTRYAIMALGRLVENGLRIKGVPTSKDTEHLARELAIPLIDLNDTDKLDLCIDGADEVSLAFDMIKGGGGALTREKLVAISSQRRIIIVDEEKLVPILGAAFRLPVEVLPFAWRLAAARLNALGCAPSLRERDGKPFETDNGNYILDCKFDAIRDPASMEKSIKLLPAVVESGLFVGIADTLVIGRSDTVEVRERAAQ
jgi:ribose 5-phosphate isomerase A